MNSHRFFFRAWYKSDSGIETKLVFGKDFQLDFDSFGNFFLGDPSPRLVDLLRVCLVIFIVDRLVKRMRGDSRSWSRDLSIRIEVLDPAFWCSQEVQQALQETIHFLTDDWWDFEFVKDKHHYEWMRPLLTRVFTRESPLVCLYSGGLDSAAGLALRLQEFPGRPILPVTVRHQAIHRKLVKGQFRLLKDRLGARIEPLQIWAVRSQRGATAGIREERTQRGRALLFAATGAVAAAMSGVSAVEVFESGVGAINVPLLASMVSTRATRSSHPEFLRRVSCLASLVAGSHLSFRLPFFERTKGEMVRELGDLGLADLARRTISCARYPRGYGPNKPCGFCPACLFRRQAMCIAEIDEPKGTYYYDLFGSPEQINDIAPEKLIYLKAFAMQVAEWTEIETTGSLPDPVERYLRHTGIIEPGESSEPIMRLLIRNRDEWLNLAAGGRRRGYWWAGLLTPAQSPDDQGASHAIA